jgi:hypothetical protein
MRLHRAWLVAGVTFLVLLSAACFRSSVGVMVLPMVASLCDDALQAVPRSLREAGYAMARLALLEADPAVKAAGIDRVWRQEQRTTAPPTSPKLLELDAKVWSDSLILSGSEPGAMSVLSLLRRDDGRLFSLVICWNDARTPLDEAKFRELAGKGLEILAKEGRPTKAAIPNPQGAEGGKP